MSGTIKSIKRNSIKGWLPRLSFRRGQIVILAPIALSVKRGHGTHGFEWLRLSISNG